MTNINGIMIDCSRCIERHEYYFQLIDFMSEWGMDTLLFHFADDQGLSIKLDGFENISKFHSFSVDEIRKLIEYASQRNIDIIPEIETFGHTRYLTNQPQYRHLAIAPNKETYTFTAINPLNTETYELMEKLICATAKLFSSQYLHVGCDEVNIEDYCNKKKLDAADVWSGYVNKIISITKETEKMPMLWADHLEKDEKITKQIDKDAVLVSWNYSPDVSDDGIKRLKSAGFSQIITAPSIACYLARFLPGNINLQNVERMVNYTLKHNLMGMINTIWCPYRYFQKAMYYGIAYSAYLMQNKGQLDIGDFNKKFAKKVFGTEFDKSIAEFLSAWPDMQLPVEFFWQYIQNRSKPNENIIEVVHKVNELGKNIFSLTKEYQPKTNSDIWQEMVLAAEALWACSEGYIILEEDSSPERRTQFTRIIERLYNSACEIWDRDRFPDDETKIQPAFKKEENEYALLILRWFMEKVTSS